MDENSIIVKANSLFKELLSTYDDKYLYETIVSGIYDTAWISMVQKKPLASDLPEWAFPMCFDFLCQNQADDGGWGFPVSLVDHITCSFVSLLAILKHLSMSSDSRLGTVNICDHHTLSLNRSAGASVHAT